MHRFKYICSINYSAMKRYFVLDKKEKKQEWLLIILALVFFSTIGIGVYCQSHNINYNNVLIPTFCFSFGCFFLLNGYNGVTKGNLILKYAPAGIPFFLQYLFIKTASFSAHKARAATARMLGILSLLIAGACFLYALLAIG